jgi:hypothetical protein
MKIANVASIEPGNIWTSDEFVVPVRDDLLMADEAEVGDAVMQVCSEINCQGAAYCLCPVVSVTGVCGRLAV